MIQLRSVLWKNGILAAPGCFFLLSRHFPEERVCCDSLQGFLCPSEPVSSCAALGSQDTAVSRETEKGSRCHFCDTGASQGSLFYSFFEPEHPGRKLFIHLFCRIRITGPGMMAVEEFHDVEPAAVHVKMDIPLFEIGRDCFPDLYFRMQALARLPCGIADTLAVDMRRYK